MVYFELLQKKAYIIAYKGTLTHSSVHINFICPLMLSKFQVFSVCLVYSYNLGQDIWFIDFLNFLAQLLFTTCEMELD